MTMVDVAFWFFCVPGVLGALVIPFLLVRNWRRIEFTSKVVGMVAALAAAFIPFAFFFLSDAWVQAELRQILASFV